MAKKLFLLSLLVLLPYNAVLAAPRDYPPGLSVRRSPETSRTTIRESASNLLPRDVISGQDVVNDYPALEVAVSALIELLNSASAPPLNLTATAPSDCNAAAALLAQSILSTQTQQSGPPPSITLRSGASLAANASLPPDTVALPLVVTSGKCLLAVDLPSGASQPVQLPTLTVPDTFFQDLSGSLSTGGVKKIFDDEVEFVQGLFKSPAAPNFQELLKESKAAFKSEGLLLSVSVAAIKKEVEAAYDVSEISKTVDYINVGTYD